MYLNLRARERGRSSNHCLPPKDPHPSSRTRLGPSLESETPARSATWAVEIQVPEPPPAAFRVHISRKLDQKRQEWNTSTQGHRARAWQTAAPTL